LVEVQTEKAVSEIEAEEEGILEKIIVKRGEIAKVGDALGVIGEEKKMTESNDDAAASSTDSSNKKEKKASNFVRIAPGLRKLAKGEQLTGIRKTISDRMRTSLQNSAQLTETAYADVTKLSEHRKQVETE